MFALSGPTLLNQPAIVAPKPKLMPKDSVELGKTLQTKGGVYLHIISWALMHFLTFPLTVQM